MSAVVMTMPIGTGVAVAVAIAIALVVIIVRAIAGGGMERVVDARNPLLIPDGPRCLGCLLVRSPFPWALPLLVAACLLRGCCRSLPCRVMAAAAAATAAVEWGRARREHRWRRRMQRWRRRRRHPRPTCLWQRRRAVDWHRFVCANLEAQRWAHLRDPHRTPCDRAAA